MSAPIADHRPSEPGPSHLPALGGAIAASLGAIALLGWVGGMRTLTTFGQQLFPMAPSTAVAFLLLGGAIAVAALRPQGAVARRIALVLGGMATCGALVLLVQRWQGILWQAEHLGFACGANAQGVPEGHMSPLTAAGFVLAGLAFLLAQRSGPTSRRWGLAAVATSGCVLASGAIFLLGYLYGKPWMYGGPVIPPALPTVLGLTAIGAATGGMALQRSGPSQPPGVAQPRPTAAIAVFAVVALAIIIAGYGYFRHVEVLVRSEVERQLIAITDLKVSHLAEWRNERRNDMGLFLANPAFTALVRRFLEHPDDAEAQQSVRAWLSHLQGEGRYEQVQLLDPHLVPRLILATASPPAGEPIAPAVVARLQAGEPLFEDFAWDARLHRPYLRMLVPVGDGPGQLVAVLAVRMDPEKDIYPSLQRWPVPSDSAETLLVRRDGDDVLFLNRLRFREDAALRMRIPLTRTDIASVQAVLGRQGLTQAVDYRGAPILADLRAIPDSPWFVVTRIDQAEVYAPLRERLWGMLVLVGFLVVGAGVLLWVRWRQQLMHAYRERALLADDLHAAKENLDITLRSIGDAVIATDLEGRVTRMNLVAEALTGWSQAEAQGQLMEAVFRIVHAETRAPAENPLHKVLATGAVVGLANHTALISRDGTEYQIADSAAPIRDAHGRVSGVVLVFRDVTREYAVQKALRESEAKWSRIFEVLPVGVCVLDAARKVVEINPAAEGMFRMSKADALRGRHESRQYVDGDGGPMPISASISAQAMQENRVVGPVEVGMTTEDGQLVWMQVGAAPLAAEGAACVVVTADITERKRIESFLEMAHEVLRVLDDPAPVEDSMRRVMAILKERTGFEAVGIRMHAGEDFPYLAQEGFPEEFMLTENSLIVRDVACQGCRDDQGRIRLACTCGLVLSGTAIPAHPSYTPGGSFWTNDASRLLDLPVEADPRHLPRNQCAHHGYASVALVPIRVKDRIAGLIQLNDRTRGRLSIRLVEILEGIASHIGESLQRKHAERELREANQALREASIAADKANLAKSQFLSTMSHEIRTPLNGIIGLADMLIVSGLSAEQASMAKMLQGCGDALVAVIGDVLDMAKIESGNMELDLQEIEVRHLATEIQAMFTATILSKGLSLVVEVDPAVPERVLGDTVRLRQVVLNLVGNAVKFTEQGGVALTVGVQSAGDRVTVIWEVSDTGPGIPDDYLARLFEPFSQANATASRKHGGTGLGLAIAKRLTELMGGTLTCTTELGKGTSFRCAVPLRRVAPVEVAAAAGAEGDPAAWSHPPTVLVVEDDAASQFTLTLMLTNLGCLHRLAENGNQAVAAVAAGGIDIVLMDCQMPECDGYTATRMIRSQAAAGTRRLPIIALTANVFTEDRERCFAAGMDDFLTKPCTLEVLKVCLARWIGSRERQAVP